MTDATQDKPLPHPQSGGTYIREADGSLTPVPGSQTAPAAGRARRSADLAAGQTQDAAAPASAAPAHTQE